MKDIDRACQHRAEEFPVDGWCGWCGASRGADGRWHEARIVSVARRCAEALDSFRNASQSDLDSDDDLWVEAERAVKEFRAWESGRRYYGE